MRLATFRAPAGNVTYGVVRGDRVHDTGHLLAARFADLQAAIAADALADLDRCAADAPVHALAEVQWLPPLPRPPKLVMIGLNYRAHQRELGLPEPKHPVVIARFANSQVGHGQPLVRPRASGQFDYEGELAVVIGRHARAVPEADALDYVAGYSCYMDGTVRDFQKHTSQVTPAKSFPGTGAFGPWIATADEVGDPNRLDLVTRLNGAEVQRTSTADMIWNVQQLVAYLSIFLELEPGDVICTGTTSGVGSMRTPPLWLKAGDQIEVDLQSVGMLANPVVDEA
jgi:2-keto-4-pentenoate hydratase/2-oxohepta-3-ene-1,7-dioic acid hydratase in catechol pathway